MHRKQNYIGGTYALKGVRRRLSEIIKKITITKYFLIIYSCRSKLQLLFIKDYFSSLFFFVQPVVTFSKSDNMTLEISIIKGFLFHSVNNKSYCQTLGDTSTLFLLPTFLISSYCCVQQLHGIRMKYGPFFPEEYFYKGSSSKIIFSVILLLYMQEFYAIFFLLIARCFGQSIKLHYLWLFVIPKSRGIFSLRLNLIYTASLTLLFSYQCPAILINLFRMSQKYKKEYIVLI